KPRRRSGDRVLSEDVGDVEMAGERIGCRELVIDSQVSLSRTAMRVIHPTKIIGNAGTRWHGQKSQHRLGDAVDAIVRDLIVGERQFGDRIDDGSKPGKVADPER